MILCDEQRRVFTLHTRHTTYQMKADDYGVLLHTYYGPRTDGDMTFLIQYEERGFSPNIADAGERRDYSLNTLPQEYSTSGVGDYRPSSLQLEREDGSYMADPRFERVEVRPGKYALEGLPAFFGAEEEADTLVVTLRDRDSDIAVELYYGVFEEWDLITRAVRVVNRSDRAIVLRQAASLCLDIPRGDLDLITFDGRHTMERQPNRAVLRPGGQSVGSIRGASSHQHNPFVVLCERDAGEYHGDCIGAMLVYSGNFQATVDRCPFDTSRLVLGIHPYRFAFTLEPGQSFTAPEAAMIFSADGFTPMSQQFHRAMRHNLIRDVAEHPVLVNSWEATYFDFDSEKLVEIAEAAAPLGIELFVMDDGWFGKRNNDDSGLGDWFVNTDKLPGGLEALVPRIQALGMKFGLWVEPEMVSEDSDLYRAHPDWVLGLPGKPHARGRSQLVLDFSRRDVREYIYKQLERVLSSADISYIKWDMNRSLTEVWSSALPANRQGEVYHRFVLGVYEFLERLRQDFPRLLIEGCCGGGGRFDAGMLYYCPQIWCSDNTDAVDRLRIQYGTSFAYPPCTMGAHVSVVPNHQTRRVSPLETRGTVAMCGAFGYELDLSRLSAEEKEIISRQVAFYKKHSSLLRDGNYYRLTSPFREGPFTAWELVSEDRRRAMYFMVTNQIHSSPPFLTLRWRGLSPHQPYRLDWDGKVYSGEMLMNAGYPMRMPPGDYQSIILSVTAADDWEDSDP